jgi:hypothetical protein
MNPIPDLVHKLVRLGVLTAYAAAIEWIAFRAGNPTDPWWWVVDIPFSLWIVAPIAVPLILRFRHWLLTGGVTAMAAYGVYIYEGSMFGPAARSTSALIFIFLPIYQWVGTAVLIVIASVMSRRTSQR